MLSFSTGMCMITWVESMRMWWRSWWLHCAPSALPSSGWDPARWCWSGLSLTVLAWTLSCGVPSSFPWSLLLLLRLDYIFIPEYWHKIPFVYQFFIFFFYRWQCQKQCLAGSEPSSILLTSGVLFCTTSWHWTVWNLPSWLPNGCFSKVI